MISLFEKCPELLDEWDYFKNIGLNPHEISYGSNLKVYWKCKKDGFEWVAKIKDRCVGKTGCPLCAGKVVLENVNDFASNNPELMKEWDFELNTISPNSITSHSHAKVHWVCSKDKTHKWIAQVSSRVTGEGCPYCNGKVIRGINDFGTLQPELLKEWDFSKNEILPYEISQYSNKQVWWICKFGHSWRTSVSNRTANKSGCPYCNNKKVMKGVNDLFTLKPELMKEWDYSKNSLNPEECFVSSNKEVYWICEKGHSWKARISSRTIQHQNCPYCSGKRVITGENDLFTLHPEFMKEWDFDLNTNLDPKKLSPYSNKYAFWKCELGHSWKTRIADRTYGKNCPYCNSRKLLRGFNDLLTKNKELCEEWNWNKNKFSPSNVMNCSKKRVWWKCKKCGYEWVSTIVNRTINHNGCPNCAKKKQTSFPEKILAFYLGNILDVKENIFIEKWNVDLLVNEKICIEYDGEYYHNHQLDKDCRKTTDLEKLGYVVIHILGKSKKCDYVKYSNFRYELYGKNNDHFKLLIKDLCDYLQVDCPDVNVERDINMIKEKVK